MNPVEYAWLIPFALLIWWLIKGERGCILPAVLPLITASDVSSRIAEVIRNIVLNVFEVLTPLSIYWEWRRSSSGYCWLWD